MGRFIKIRTRHMQSVHIKEVGLIGPTFAYLHCTSIIRCSESTLYSNAPASLSVSVYLSVCLYLIPYLSVSVCVPV